MPNWVFNTIAVKGNVEDVKSFLIKGATNKGISLPTNSTITEICNLFNEKTDEGAMSLTSFVPMPQTYRDFDTTNHSFGKGISFNLIQNTKLLEKFNFEDEIELRKTIFDYMQLINDELVTLLITDNNSIDDYLTNKSVDIVDAIMTKCNVSSDNRSNISTIITDFLTTLKKNVTDFYNATNEQKEKYGVVGWYEWGLKNLGTKWDSSLENWDFEECGNNEVAVFMYCETAWSIPTEWLMTIKKENPNLRMACRTCEEQPAWNGYFNVDDDEWIENYTYDDIETYIYDENNEIVEYNDELSEKIEDNFNMYVLSQL